MPDWYRDHSLSPECYPESGYLDWAQDHGLYVDAAGNVDYGPPEAPGEDVTFPEDPAPAPALDWGF